MTRIYFNSNEFASLSEEVKAAMKQAVEDFADANPKGFGNDCRVEAESEEIKSSISEKLKAESYHFHFTNGLPQSEIELINLSVLQLDVELIITTVFENNDKLNYLKQLEETGKIKLHLLKTSDFGEIDLEDLKHFLEANKSKTLISLSHANSFTGVLLPVKDVAKLAKQYNTYFHLDSSLMIGKYKIDLSKVEIDFFSFDVSLINGPVGVGCLLMNEKLAISDEQFSNLRNVFKFTENKNIVLISGLKAALLSAFKKNDIWMKNTGELKSYFIAEIENKLKIKTIDHFLRKTGLCNQLAFFVPKEEFGEYLIERLDLNGFVVAKEKYPVELEDFFEHYFINISLSAKSVKHEVDSFLAACLMQ